MKNNESQNRCDMIRDLLPLYQDNVCSEGSRVFVEDHLKSCPDCRSELARLKNTCFEDRLTDETKEVLGNHAKMEKRRTATVGMITAGVLMIPLIICLICNLVSGDGLDWFYIVLTSLMVFASITVLPMLVPRKKMLWTLCGFTASLLLLLFTINVYTHGTWFYLTAVSVILGLSVAGLPFAARQIPLPAGLRNQKSLLVMIWDTLWLFALIAACGFYTNGTDYWSVAVPITLVCTAAAWLIFICLRYIRVHPLIRAGMIAVFTGCFTAGINFFIYWILGESVQTYLLAQDWIYNLIIGMVIAGAGLILIALGIWRSLKSHSSSNTSSKANPS